MSDHPRSGPEPVPPAGYLGIDFGTSTTHVAVCYLDGNNVPQTVPVAGQPSVASYLLWKDPGERDEDVVAFGDRSLQVWATMPGGERAGHRLAAWFKPDLVGGTRAASAQRDARAFLKKCYEAVRDGGFVRAVGGHEGMPVVIGTPAEVGREQKEVTARLAREAGFGAATPVEEPLGALAFHLADGSVTAEEARRGVVVVDFGGGTLDVAWLDARHGLRAPWGDPALGGRLFDDLFYQWLLEQNPGLDLGERDRAYVWLGLCRDLKERFSVCWEREGPDAKHTQLLVLPDRRLAEFVGSPAEFLRRASAYLPSGPAATYFAAVGGGLAALGRDGPEDLIDKVRRELARGGEGRHRSIARVVLTGGSSRWPFMRDLAAEAFGVARDQVLRSAHPETTVGSGLAVYHVLRHRNGMRQAEVVAEFPAARRRFEEAVARRVDQFITEAVAALVDPVMEYAESAYVEWYRRGGALHGVKCRVLSHASGRNAAAALAGRDAALAQDLVRLLRDHLTAWLHERGVERDAGDVVPPGELGVAVPPLGDHAGEIAGVVSDLAGVTLAGAVFAAVYLAAHGTHILAHPLTGIPVAVGSAIASAVGYKLVDDRVRDGVMAYEWGSASLTALSAVLSEQRLRRKIAEGRKEVAHRVAALLRNGPECVGGAGPCPGVPSHRWTTLGELQRAVSSQFEQLVTQAARDLGVLEEITRG